MANSHPASDYLRNYAAGNTSEPVSLIIATHLAMCPTCRQDVEAYEAIGGTVLNAAPLSNQVTTPLATILAKLGEVEPVIQPSDKASSKDPVGLSDGDILLPKPLRAYLPVDTVYGLKSLKWSGFAGYKELPFLKENQTMKTRLMCISAGASMPQHTHEGTELTLVLSGGFKDQSGHYISGDLVVADAHVDHTPRADSDSDCICLAVLDAPLKLTGPIGRLINPFVNF